MSLGHRRLYLMLFEDGNRIDLTLCPKESIQEWVDSEAGFKVLKDDKGLFDSYIPSPKRYWTAPPTEEEFAASCNEFWWVSAYVVKAIQKKSAYLCDRPPLWHLPARTPQGLSLAGDKR